jgi:hypothetical protein
MHLSQENNGMPVKATTSARTRSLWAIAGAAMLTLYGAIPAYGHVTGLAGSTGATGWANHSPAERAVILIASQESDGSAETAADQSSTAGDHNKAETDSQPPPAESKDLKPFRPSEEIEADQEVDFPYDI